MTNTPTFLRTTKCHPGNAWWMARLSELSYDVGDDRSAACALETLKALDSDFESAHAFDKNSSQGMVIEHKAYIAVAFRGTDEPADWLDNINALAVDHPLGEVHRGFQTAMMDVWPAMKARIRAIRQNREKEALAGTETEVERRRARLGAHLPLYITGHSLGGAMAILAAAQLVDADEPFYSVYTYGQPRVGDRDFEKHYKMAANSKTFRFQNNNDIVTRVPARVMGYRHVGEYFYIDESGDLTTDPGTWYRFLDSVRGVVKDIGEAGLDSIDDHDIVHYREAIERAQGNWPVG